jgi:replicative DNA helicase
VVAATDVMLGRPCYEVAFSDGTVIVADAAHQWPTCDGVRTSAQLRCGLDTIAPAGSTAHHMAGRTAVLAPSLQVVTVRRVASVAVRCVQVDNSARLYLAGRGMVPTHNSTLGLDFLRSCSIKHRMASVIFSLEMSKSEIVMRLLSAEAKIKLGDMRSGRMNDDDWTRLARRMSEISEAPLYIDDSPNLTMMEIRAKARRLRQKANLKLVVVDYLQLMTSGKKVESRQIEVSEFSRHLKLLAKELEVPVVAISQLNRGPEQRTDKKPMLSDLRESGSLEQDADMVILLNRPDAFDRDDPRGGEADFILAKHRNGPTKTVTVAHQLHLSRFANMAR